MIRDDYDKLLAMDEKIADAQARADRICDAYAGVPGLSEDEFFDWGQAAIDRIYERACKRVGDLARLKLEMLEPELCRLSELAGV